MLNPRAFINARRQHDLLDILLGYGSHNTRSFQTRHGMRLMRVSAPFFSQVSSDPEDNANNDLQDFDEMPELLSRIGVVNFTVDKNHPETVALEKKYRALSQKLLQIYDGEDWFERTLEQLINSG
jgi:hypothetical protein